MMRTITVRGVGNVSARPDYITISMTIESIRKDYDEAMRDASERISKLQDVAVRSGYAKEDLKTTSFNVDTRYESVKDRLTRSFSLTVRYRFNAAKSKYKGTGAGQDTINRM